MVTKNICKPRKNAQNRLAFQDKCSVDVSDEDLSILVQKGSHLSDTIPKIWIPSDK